MNLLFLLDKVKKTIKMNKTKLRILKIWNRRLYLSYIFNLVLKLC